MKRNQSKRGVILVVVLWILVILSIMAIGLSYKTSVELSLTKHSLRKMKTKHAALGGVNYAIDKILASKDSATSGEKIPDTRYQCGFRLESGQTPEDLFKEVPIGDSFFNISYKDKDATGENSTRYGFLDEESRINLNTIRAKDHKIIKYLVGQFEHDDNVTEIIAASIIDWRDKDQNVFNAPNGAEDDYYQTLSEPYVSKNKNFESIDELKLVRGITPEIFNQLEPYLTIFPVRGKFAVNLNTASRQVLLALARNYSGAQTNTEEMDADSLVEKMLLYRRGGDGVDGTEDDKVLDLNALPLTAKERVIALMMQRVETKTSRYLRVHVIGRYQETRVATDIEAVINRDDTSIVYWKER